MTKILRKRNLFLLISLLGLLFLIVTPYRGSENLIVSAMALIALIAF